MFTHASMIVALVAVLLASLPSAVANLEDLDQADFFDHVMTGSDDYMVFITREDDPNEAAGEMLEEM